MKRQEMVFVLGRGGAMLLPCSGEKAVWTVHENQRKGADGFIRAGEFR